MEKQSIERFLNKKVKIQLRNNNVYTITITKVNEFDFLATDKFNNRMCISNNDVFVIEENGR